MSDEIFVGDPSWGEFVVSANGHFDKDAGLWLKPWTNRPNRVDIGFIIFKHPEDEIVGYTYLLPDPMTGVMRWYFGPHGDPERDLLINEINYRIINDE